MLDDPNIASDAASTELLKALFEEMEPVAEAFAEAHPEWRTRISGRLGEERVCLLGFLGSIAWEIFSENNEVVGPDGKVFDLGSWRSSGGFIADVLNERLSDPHFHYLDFYMGLLSPRDEDLRPLYVRFFEFLKDRDCEWRYAPPAIFLLSFGKQSDDAPSPAEYDPEKAVREDIEATKEIDEMRAKLEKSNRDAFRKAVENPPVIVRAYEDAYGRRPEYIGSDR